MSQGIAESAVNVLDTVLKLQQLLAGSATSLLNLYYVKLGLPLDLLNLYYMKQSLQSNLK